TALGRDRETTQWGGRGPASAHLDPGLRRGRKKPGKGVRVRATREEVPRPDSGQRRETEHDPTRRFRAVSGRLREPMPSPYDVIVVGAGPAGGTAARYAARNGLNVLLLDKRREVGVPVQCGEYVAENDEIRGLFPPAGELDHLLEVPHRVREGDTPVIRLWPPNGRRS